MTMRTTGFLALISLAGIAAFAAVAPARAQEGAAGTPPNIADDLGYGDISPYGGWIETPRLDRMAAEGMRFLDFHSSGNVCSPTRAGLMTGRYQQRAGIPGVLFANPDRPSHDDGIGGGAPLTAIPRVLAGATPRAHAYDSKPRLH